MKHIKFFAIACALLNITATLTTHGGVVAYDDFEGYAAPSDVDGLNGGSGWSGGWSKSLKLDAQNQPIGQARVVEKSLTAAGVDGGSNALELDATTGAGRAVSRQFARQTSDVYVSFLVRAENFGGNELINIYASDALTSAAGDDINQIGVGMLNAAGNPLMVRVGQSWRAGATASQPISSQGMTSISGDTDPASTFLVVARFFKTSGIYKNGQLWVFDADDALPATTPSFAAQALDAPQTNTGIQYISVRTHALEVGERLYIDEMRIGTDWASVVAVPEPGSLSMIGLGMIVALWRSRRRRVA